jgi:lipid-A-disaccharide synthase
MGELLMKVFFSVGEPSGDLHGANLIKQLRRRDPDIDVVGYGGPKMAAAGCQLHEDLTRLAVMWFLRVVTNLHTFLGLVSRADRYFRHHRPDVVVLIDYPGFNWWIARRAKAHGIPVVYYGAPQIWAWAGWRVRKMRRLVDHVLCKLPFEEAWYGKHGCHATYVGHPYFDQLRQEQMDREFLGTYADPSRPLVTILPGSRTQEVTQNLHWFLLAAQNVARAVPNVRFAVASFRSDQANLARAMVDRSGLPVDVWVGRTSELIQLADCCMACSGSVSLELLYHQKPAVVLYWISRIAYFVQGFFRRVRYITLVNLLATDDIHSADSIFYDPDAPGAESVPYPEYLTYQDKSRQIAAHVIGWLHDPETMSRRSAQLARLRQQLVHGGASQRAAEYLLQHCQPTPKTPRPHYRPLAGGSCPGPLRGDVRNPAA